jgi:hypothetical protein
VYEALKTHVDDAFKVAPSTIPPTIGWNASMSLNKIFDQLMKTYSYSCPTPITMRQNMTTFFPPTIPRTLTRSFSSGAPSAKEIALIANVKYTNQQLLMNVIDLLTRCGLYQHNLEHWDRKPKANKTWINLHPFIQEEYINITSNPEQ